MGSSAPYSQDLVVLVALPQLPAHLRRPLDEEPVPLQLCLLDKQGLIQGQRPLLHLADGIQVKLELPQQAYLLQRPGILLRVVPVAVVQALGGQQALPLVKADVGPGHARLFFQLLDGHETTSQGYANLSSPFTVKRFFEKNRNFQDKAPLPCLQPCNYFRCRGGHLQLAGRAVSELKVLFAYFFFQEKVSLSAW